LLFRLLGQPAPIRCSAWTSWEAPDPAFWVPRGYVVVNADLRGFGHSDGVGTPLSDQEAEDYYDLIAWAAHQPWSNGRVGLNGVSYLAISQYKVAALRPPHLAAICPWEGFTDCYRDFARQGGIREDGFMGIWTRSLRRTGRLAVDLRREQRARPLLDAWWRSLQPDLARIEVPALICASFSDHSLHSRGSFEAFRRISSRERWLYTHRGGKWGT
jgi:putative CocE/NonD family hydrolase